VRGGLEGARVDGTRGAARSFANRNYYMSYELTYYML